MTNKENKNVEIVKFDTPQYNDAISRQAAIDAMREETCGCCWDAKDILAHLPPVNTEKIGRWEWKQYDYNPNLGNWHCSECGSIAIECVPKEDPCSAPLYKYCPNCGTKMSEIQIDSNCNSCKYQNKVDGSNCYECVKGIIHNNYTADSKKYYSNCECRMVASQESEEQGMRLIDANKFLVYLIYSKHIDGLTCGEVKEAIKMCEVNVLDKIRKLRAEIEKQEKWLLQAGYTTYNVDIAFNAIKAVIAESEDKT